MPNGWSFQKPRGGDPTGRGRFTALARMMRARPRDLDPLRHPDAPAQSFEVTWRTGVRGRLLVVLTVVSLWAVVIEARLVYLQVFRHEELSEEARLRQQSTLPWQALRGDIVDRQGQMLAYSVEADAIVADPRNVTNPEATATALCRALADCTPKDRQDLARKLTGKGRYAPIRSARSVSPDQTARVAALKLDGIALLGESRRYYPRAELGSHVVGFVGADNQGQAGVEYAYDSLVSGVNGLALVQVDARRHRLETRVERAPVPGATLELTIDLGLQHIAERELKAAVLEHRAAGGSAIILAPDTGEILALASYPTFNPNVAGRSSDDERRNRVVQDVYEPGSTFKIVTASAAIEEGLLSPSDFIDCSPGVITFPGRKPITEAKHHNYGVLSLEDVIVKSSNIGAIKIGLRVGADRLAQYVNRFGFGQTLLRDLVGESRGIWSPGALDSSGLASVSMGYQVSVTPLQMAAAASVVANGGTLVEPHVVRAVVRDGVREPVAPKTLRRVISSSTAAAMTTIMEGVTERGTAKAARIDRYQVAGKTGTAHKVVDGRYSDTAFNASFVGFVPSRRPAFTILVVIDTPHAGGHYGGEVAAPVFKRIAEAALQLQGVPPTIAPVPPILVTASAASLPARPAKSAAVIPALTPLGGRTLMPDVRGLGAREAIRVLGSVGLAVRIGGTGFVATQTPDPGEPIEPGGWSRLELRRVPALLDREPGGQR